MGKDLNDQIIIAIQALYKKYELAQRALDALARRSKDASVTNVETIERMFGVSRGAAVGFLQDLADAGCGNFVNGRRGSKSRLVWKFSCVSVGQVAAGVATEITAPQDPTPETDGNGLATLGNDAPASIGPLTIAEAKKGLAEGLGVRVESIEITVRA